MYKTMLISTLAVTTMTITEVSVADDDRLLQQMIEDHQQRQAESGKSIEQNKLTGRLIVFINPKQPLEKTAFAQKMNQALLQFKNQLGKKQNSIHAVIRFQVDFISPKHYYLTPLNKKGDKVYLKSYDAHQLAKSLASSSGVDQVFVEYQHQKTLHHQPSNNKTQ